MKVYPLKAPLMGRVCKRGHLVAGENAIWKKIAGRDYTQCRQCRNEAEMKRRRFIKNNPQALLKISRTQQIGVS